MKSNYYNKYLKYKKKYNNLKYGGSNDRFDQINNIDYFNLSYIKSKKILYSLINENLSNKVLHIVIYYPYNSCKSLHKLQSRLLQQIPKDLDLLCDKYEHVYMYLLDIEYYPLGDNKFYKYEYHDINLTRNEFNKEHIIVENKNGLIKQKDLDGNLFSSIMNYEKNKINQPTPYFMNYKKNKKNFVNAYSFIKKDDDYEEINIINYFNEKKSIIMERKQAISETLLVQDNMINLEDDYLKKNNNMYDIKNYKNMRFLKKKNLEKIIIYEIPFFDISYNIEHVNKLGLPTSKKDLIDQYLDNVNANIIGYLFTEDLLFNIQNGRMNFFNPTYIFSENTNIGYNVNNVPLFVTFSTNMRHMYDKCSSEYKMNMKK